MSDSKISKSLDQIIIENRKKEKPIHFVQKNKLYNNSFKKFQNRRRYNFRTNRFKINNYQYANTLNNYPTDRSISFYSNNKNRYINKFQANFYNRPLRKRNLERKKKRIDIFLNRRKFLRNNKSFAMNNDWRRNNNPVTNKHFEKRKVHFY